MELLRDPEFWVFIAFVIGVGIMLWKGTGMLNSMLDARAQRIKAQLDESRKAREEAANHFGWLAHFVAIDCPASSAQTRQGLGWAPKQLGLIADLDQLHYFETALARARA